MTRSSFCEKKEITSLKRRSLLVSKSRYYSARASIELSALAASEIPLFIIVMLFRLNGATDFFEVF